MRLLQMRSVFHCGLSPAEIHTGAQRWSTCQAGLATSPPGCSRARSWLDGSKWLCVHGCVVLSKGRIPSTKQYCSAIWFVFYGSSEAFCPLLKAVLETLIRYLSNVCRSFSWLKEEGEECWRTTLQHILLTLNQQKSTELKGRQKDEWLLCSPPHRPPPRPPTYLPPPALLRQEIVLMVAGPPRI